MLAIGVSMVVDMTSRRALVYDFVGQEHVTNALALESLAMTGGTLMGNVSAGAVISVLGIGQAFCIVVALYALSFAILLGVPALKKPPAITTGRPNIIRDLRAAFAYLRGNRTLISILGITVIMNLFYHSFIPMIPLFADRLGVNAFWTGVLASSIAFGSMLGAFAIAHGLRISRGRVYVVGSAIALAFVCLFAASHWYPLALLSLICAGLGIAGFTTMQGAFVMLSTRDEMRGRAMGLLSMSIGVLPFSMLLLGGVAQAVGPSTAVIGSVLTGLIVIVAWAYWRPEAQRVN
jgi:MFS family permease